MIQYKYAKSPAEVVEWLNSHSNIQVISITYDSTWTRYVIFYEDKPKEPVQMEDSFVISMLQNTQQAQTVCHYETTFTEL